MFAYVSRSFTSEKDERARERESASVTAEGRKQREGGAEKAREKKVKRTIRERKK
uniref:Uncharacterized protein n=1 Tax=Anguilla anguilla TaxID=7936 RepID=A0A0E9UAW9_ANGAN